MYLMRLRLFNKLLAVSFQFAQVGNDLRAREFLAKLDRNPRIGHLIDCTSSMTFF